ncbi:progranulin-like [Uloborus diversus]|uniref:progranulin-like n=1 Tax=Uloborus diversus TaxID=327109 RepID=UPI00240A1E54|nr:progranulin-like [Uloborus diversus]
MMLPISIALIFLVAPSVSYAEDVFAPEADRLSCGPGETSCGIFCCPYESATCCWDNLGCCPHGKTCIDILGIGICVGVEYNKHSNFTLTSERPAGPRYEARDCPSYMTTCGDEKCCPLPNAVCCADGERCCPNGYRCGPGSCVKTSKVPARKQMRADVLSIYNLAAGNQVPQKECPGGNRSCPKGTNCCLDDNEEWSCCPKSAVDRTSYEVIPKQHARKDQDCCTAWFGYVCCSGVTPWCTILGCV